MHEGGSVGKTRWGGGWMGGEREIERKQGVQALPLVKRQVFTARYETKNQI